MRVAVLGAGVVGVTGAWYLARPASPVAHAGAAALLVPLVLNYAWTRFDAARRSLLDIAGRACVRRVA